MRTRFFIVTETSPERKVQRKGKVQRVQRHSVSKFHVSKVQKAAIYALLNYGLDSNQIHQALIEAANTFSHVSVAGCKAAITKGYLLKT